jgi:hypothetical protein
MTVDLIASGLSELILFGPQSEDPDKTPPIKRILLPAGAEVRVAGLHVKIPAGEQRYVGPCDLTFELVGLWRSSTST